MNGLLVGVGEASGHVPFTLNTLAVVQKVFGGGAIAILKFLVDVPNGVVQGSNGEMIVVDIKYTSVVVAVSGLFPGNNTAVHKVTAQL